MKKIIFLLFTMLSFLYSADSLEWYNSYDSAKAAAQKSHKKILLLVVSPTCPYCIELLNNPLKDPEVVKTIKASYEPLMLLNHEELPANISVRGVPAMYQISNDGKKLGAPLVGLQEPTLIKAWLVK